MAYFLKALIALAVICFFIAALSAVFQTYQLFTSVRLPASADGFSSACTNILLLAIALKVCLKPS